MNKLLPILMAAISVPCAAQDDVTDLLTAQRVKEYVNVELRVAGDDPPFVSYYQIDTDDVLKFKLLEESVSVLSATGFPLYLKDYQPLTMIITSSIKEEDDPTVAAVGQFIDAVSGLGNLIRGVGTEKTADSKNKVEAATAVTKEEVKTYTKAEDPERKRREKAIETLAQQAEALGSIKSEEIHAWFQAYLERPWCFRETADQDKLWHRFKEIDQAIFATSEEVLAGILKGGRNAKSGTEVKKLARDLKGILTNLQGAIDNAERESILSGNFSPDWYDYKDNPAERLGCTFFKRQTNDTIAALVKRAQSVNAARRKLKIGVDSLAGELEKISDKYRGDRFYEFAYVKDQKGKIQELSFTVKKRDVKISESRDKIEISEGKGITRKIRVHDYNKVIPSVATGFVFSDVTYPQFGTEEIEIEENGTIVKKTIVKEVEPGSEEVQAALLLNLVIRTGGENFHPLVQFGVSSGQERPALLIGGGIRFSQPKWLTVSFGVLLPWKRELSDLSPGDPVTGTAQIEEDLNYSLDSSLDTFYLSFQYTF